jgi:Pretoxin HINT domain
VPSTNSNPYDRQKDYNDWRRWEEEKSKERGRWGKPFSSATDDHSAHNRGLIEGGHKPACFPANANIFTVGGKQAISSLQKGDYVLSRSRAGALVARRITDVKVHSPSYIWVIGFDDHGPKIRTTGSHTVLSRRGWIRVSCLRSGDELVQPETGIFRRVQRISATDDAEPVYNLSTEGEHNFIVEGIVAHNFTTLRRVRTLMHRLLIDPLLGIQRGRRMVEQVKALAISLASPHPIQSASGARVRD